MIKSDSAVSTIGGEGENIEDNNTTKSDEGRSPSTGERVPQVK